MKRIRVALLTLVLSISMLVPEFSMLPAVYAQDETPAVTQSVDSAADAEAPAESAVDPAANSADTAADTESGDRAPGSADSVDQAFTKASVDETGSYDMIYMTSLYDADQIVIPDEMKDKITIEPAEYGKGLLFTGKVEDLNSLQITIGKEFNFDSGSAGRLLFDGLRDKDRGMSVEAGIYLDNSETPLEEIPLSKQMGKREWANRGDKSVSLGSKEIIGKHKVSLRLKISGKKDSAKTTVMLRAIQFCKTTLPVMYFNIDESEGTIEAMNSSEDHSVECYGSVDLVVPDAFNADKTFRDEYGEQDSLSGLELEYIRGRGNSTWSEEKKPYKVKFDKAQDLFGFGKNKHWVLLANRFDNSLVRNRMTYWLGQQLGMEYTPQCVPVEVVMNGEFYGSYLLCEQIRVGKGRVTIDDLDDVKDAPDFTDELIKTGGYLLSMDFMEDEKRSFTTEKGMQLYIESPDDNVAYFSDYIKAYTQKVENAIFGENFKDKEGHPYTDYLDMDSAVDYWWVQEFSANGDAYGSGSTYLYKKRDDDTGAGKLYWGPLWDFDFVAWGDLDYDSDAPDNLDYTTTPWFEEMKGDPVFISKVKARWTEKGGLRDQLTEITKKGGRLDKYIKQMETSYRYDHELWGSYDSKLTEYKDEIEQLRGWINKRIEYTDAAVSEMNTDPHHVKFMIDGKVVKEVEVTGVLRSSDIPEVPKKSGMVFQYWEDEEGIAYNEGSRITADVTVSAFYIDEDDVVEAKDIFFKSYDLYYPAYIGENSYEGSDWLFIEHRVMPDGAAYEITWESSDPEVAEITDNDGDIRINSTGDVTITATLDNGVSRSMNLHVVSYEDLKDYETTTLNKESLTLKRGGYAQILTTSSPRPCEEPDFIWVSTNEDVASVDDMGIVTAIAPGTADVLAVNMLTRETMRCRVTVKSGSNLGKIVKRGGSTYKITSDKSSKRRAKLVKAKNAKTVTIPAYIKLNGKKYYINRIGSRAFAKSKATKVIIKTKKLTRSCVKKSLKGSKVKIIKVKTGKKNLKKYVKKYKKIFTKKNAGRKVTVR